MHLGCDLSCLWVRTKVIAQLVRIRKPWQAAVRTRNFYSEEFIPSYRGILILLMQKHLEFQIVTPRTLAEFRGRTLVLPGVRALNQSEQQRLKELLQRGKDLFSPEQT